MYVYLATALVLLIYFVIVWFGTTLLHLQGQDLWILRGSLGLIGLIGAAIFLWFYLRVLKRKAAPAGSGPSSGGTNAEIETVIREAETRLRSSNLGRSASLNKLPAVFLVGDPGSAKTSSMVHSGFDVDLLGGQVYEETNIVPTRSANLWYGKHTLFVEANTKAADLGVWARVLRRLRPGRLSSLRGGDAPRGAVVCFSCEAFLQTGAADGVAAAVRRLRNCLEEVARSLGINFPVYVLFTKADRIPFFAEFSRNLTPDEAAEVLGVTLPLQSGQDKGVYAEQEGRRLNAVFNNLTLSLADKRPELLAREHDPNQLAGIYEFPRELRKLRSLVVQMLTDLCRPSQLRATPFLRGFYFSGVRAVIINEVARPAAQPQARSSSFRLETEATGIFNVGQAGVMPPAAQPQAATARKVPHWAFLTHFFSDVLLKDKLAMATTTASVKTSALRRVLLVSGIAVCLLLSLAWLISYSGNTSLENEVAAAARAISTGEVSPNNVPSIADLQQLDNLRQSLDKLSRYRKDGAPWRLRWGLYTGNELYPDARRVYFRRFQQLLFASTQAELMDFLKRLPSVPAPSDDYGTAYNTLKAYLITTSNHDKSTQMFLSPELLKRWTQSRTAGADSTALAQKQFDFYSEELKSENPFSSENDSLTVERARRYLSQFAVFERVYQSMLADAAQKGAGISFNKQYPGSSEVLINSKEISGAFTKAGWTFMQDAIKNVDRFFSGEQWVLGQQGAGTVDRVNLDQKLKERYTADFIAQWLQFLRAGNVVRYGTIKDASSKLTKLSNNQSPLLAMLCVASQNTNVDSPPIKTAFQPVQTVVVPTCTEKYISENNAGYMNSLVALSAVIEQMANASGSAEALTGQAISSASQAKIVTRQMAQKFQIDSQTHVDSTVQKLMEDPITYVEGLVRNVGPAELNGKGKGICTQFSEVTSKYPFNPKAKVEATLQEVNAIFQPQQGALWAFYEANLKNLLTRQGSQFVAKPDPSISLTPAFLSFWNRAAAFTDAMYPSGSMQPRITYTVRQVSGQSAENVTLSIDGQTLNVAGGAAASHEFVWSGNPNSEVKLSAGGLSYSGAWAHFQFFGDAEERWTRTGTAYTLQWNLRLGRATPLIFRFDLDMGKADPVFWPQFLSNLRCVSEIAR